jgi:hypothetical protein
MQLFSYHADRAKELVSTRRDGPLDPTQAYCGIELEYAPAAGHTQDEQVRWFSAKHDHSPPTSILHKNFVLMQDSSVYIDRRHGLETVSRILTFDEGREYATELCRDLTESEARLWRVARPNFNAWNEHIGMHVHVSRAPYTRNNIARMILFMYNQRNRPFHEAIARRNLAQTYCRGNYKRSWTKAYTQLPTTFPHAAWLTHAAEVDERVRPYEITRSYEGVGYDVRQDQRFEALNLTNRRTIEFRLFKSSTEANIVRSNLEYCYAVIEFCTPGRSLRELYNVAYFCNYVAANAARFPALASRIAQNSYARFRSEQRNNVAATRRNIIVRGSTIAIHNARGHSGMARAHALGMQIGIGAHGPSTGDVRDYVRRNGMPNTHITRHAYVQWYMLRCRVDDNNEPYMLTSRGNVISGAPALRTRAMQRLRAARVSR